MRLVIDCNVLVAAARGSDTCRTYGALAIAAHEPVVSAPILAEYREVGTRPKHLAYCAAFDAMIGRWKRVVIEVKLAQGSFGLPDSDDEVYLAMALAGQVEALVTGNHRHFPQDSSGGVAILSPRAFVDRTADPTPITPPAPR